jgi:transcriptional regulator with XRE-family HTH domain
MQNQTTEFAKNLRSHVEKSHLTQNQLSKLVGMKKSTLHSYLYGVIPSGLVNTIKLASFFNVSLDNLVLQGTTLEKPNVLKISGDYDLILTKRSGGSNV